MPKVRGCQQHREQPRERHVLTTQGAHDALEVAPGLAAAAVAGTVEAGLIHLGRTYGSTEEERKKQLPGDDIIADAGVQTDHAITIDAPPSAVWP
jgi:hypothetical protein